MWREHHCGWRGRPDSNSRSPPLQLDISGKLYLAPLTTVGGGYGGRLRGFLGIPVAGVLALLTSEA